MRTVVQGIQSDLKSFIRSAHDLLMIICCEPEDSVLLLKSLDAIEDAPTVPDIFLTFGPPFENPDDYIESVLQATREQYENVNKLLTQSGRPALPAFPVQLADGSLQWQDRLRTLLRHMRSVVPKERKLIWTFYPPSVSNAQEYLDIARAIRQSLAEDWSVRGTKAILRDGSRSPALEPPLRAQPGVRVYRPALDRESTFNRLAEKADDPKVPLDERAQMHMMLAGMDVANKRFDQALARNQELLAYFGSTGQRHHESIVLNNIGDLYYIQRRFADAEASYQRAVGASLALDSAPLVLYQSLNLGNALLAQRKFDEARVYYQAAGQLAQATSAPMYQIQALERLGSLERQCGRLDEAAQAWEKAASASKKHEYEFGLRANLERLRDLYRETGDAHRLARCELELAQVGTSEEAAR